MDENGNLIIPSGNDSSSGKHTIPSLTPDTLQQMQARLLRRTAPMQTGRVPSNVPNISNTPKSSPSSLDRLMNYLLSVEGYHAEGILRKVFNDNGQLRSSELMLDANGKIFDQEIRINPDHFHLDDFERLFSVDDQFSVVARKPDNAKSTVDSTMVLIVASINAVESRLFKNIIEANPHRETCNYVPLFVERSMSQQCQYRYHNYDQKQLFHERDRFHELIDEMRTEVICRNLI